ncbi:MAG: queuosine precursor transporter [Candidatus Omnitrophica bacterium]|nr:queuosine precursor transporter [Candidatus Omnitrophota bacterium]
MSDTNSSNRALVIQERVFLTCAAIFIASLVACNLIFQKFFHWTLSVRLFDWTLFSYTFELSVGILPYPITFLVTDIVSEIYGKRRADQIVVSGFIASFFVMLIVLLAQAAPQTSWSPVSNEEFSKVFGLYGPAVFASMTAYLLAQFIDIRVFHFWKRLTQGRHLWLRNNGSTIFSQLIDTLTVILILCIAGVIEWERMPDLVLSGFIFKMGIAILDTPFFYLANWGLRELMHLGPLEEISAQKSLA